MEPVLRLITEADYQCLGLHAKVICNLSNSKDTASGGIGGKNGEMLVEDSRRLISVETNGFVVRFNLFEVCNNTKTSNSADCFFPYGAVTVTQIFNSAIKITGRFR